ncbi:hypothetical protein SAMN05421759_1106 [Roseivivax lentus]|uniref:Uncharacterized protein n=1 Tax=Roseivivax lentus TaxID=633194 RepID=A0A1N7NS85_9RHOB|nr:hypothetical protein [Roseivivax lentus]SIT01099.1 hypothetical protein SAMN05421759_1106 [Roseivivax lentus]
MENVRPHAGLFTDPSILTAVTGVSISWGGGVAVSGYSLTLVTSITATLAPALRALRLAGECPVEIEITDFRPLSEPSGALRVTAMRLDDALTFEEVADTGHAETRLTEDPQIGFMVRIFTKPYAAKGTGPPDFGLGLILPGPEDVGEWSLAEGRASGGPGARVLELRLTGAVGPAGEDTNAVSSALKARAVEPFVVAMAHILASLLPAALPPSPEPEAAPQVNGVGLLWLLDARSWYSASVYGAAPQAADLREAALKALPAQTSAPDDLLNFFLQVMFGTDNLRKTIVTAQGAPILSFSRAGRFRRALARWDSSGTAPFAPLLPGDLSATRPMPWLDVIFFLLEAQVLLCPFLEVGGGIDDDIEEPELEPLVARIHEDMPNRLSLYHTAMKIAGESDPYGHLVHIDIEDMPRIETETLYDAPPKDDYPRMPMEEMFTWEYIPADPDDPRTDPDTAIPKVLIVAGPGVTVLTSHSEAVRVEVLRTRDYGFPPWGEPIDPKQIFQPFFRPATPPPGNADPLGTYFSDGILVVEKPDGTQYALFAGIEVNVADGQPTAPLGDPDASFDLKYPNQGFGTNGYRADFDFVEYWSDRDSDHSRERLPLLRVLRAGDIRLAAAQSTTVAISAEIYDAPSISDVHRLWPHFIPLRERIVSLGNGFQDGAPTEFPSEFPTEMVPADRALSRLTGQVLPMLEMSDFTAVHLVPLTIDGDTVPTEHIFSWPDIFLLIVDVVVGFHPYAIALDIAEFIYAYNTSRDRYGRPVTTQDLVFMAIGIGLPISGYMAAQLGRGADILKARWTPPPSAADDTATILDDVEALAAKTADERDALAARLGDALMAASDTLGSAARVAGRSIGHLMDASRRTIIDPGLSHDYRRWLLQALVEQKKPLNPLGAFSP